MPIWRAIKTVEKNAIINIKFCFALRSIFYQIDVVIAYRAGPLPPACLCPHVVCIFDGTGILSNLSGLHPSFVTFTHDDLDGLICIMKPLFIIDFYFIFRTSIPGSEFIKLMAVIFIFVPVIY